MAYLSKLDAVNAMLRAVKIRPVAALDTGGFTEAADAERLLDFHTKTLQCEGPFESKVKKSYTVASSKIVLGTDVLNIKSIGMNEHRNLTLRRNGSDSQVYDLDRDTFAFTNGDIFTFQVWVEVPFIDCGVALQNKIITYASQEFQRLYMGDPMRDQGLNETRLRAEVTTARVTGRNGLDHMSPPPFNLQGAAPAGNGG